MSDANEELMNNWDEQMFTLRVNSRYHQRRVMFFDRWNSLTNALVLISGSAAVVNLVTRSMNSDAAIVVFGGAVTLVALIDLVVGTARMARVHEILFRRYVDLDREWSRKSQPTVEDLHRLVDGHLQILADEPPPRMTLLNLCYNDISRSLGRSDRIVDIMWYQKFFANFFSFENAGRHVNSQEAAIK